MTEFPCPGPITLHARLGGGQIDVVAEDRTTALVEVTPHDNSEAARNAAAQTRVEMHDGQLHVDAPEAGANFLFRRSPRVKAHVRVPLDSSLDVRLASADLTGRGRFGSGNVRTASGDIHLDHVAGDLAVHTASGDVRLARVDGRLQLTTASGDLRAQTLDGDASVQSASGDLDIEQLGASFQATTASGDITVGAVRRGTFAVKSASGDVSVGVEAGTGVWLDLTTISGSTRSDLSAPDPGGAAPRADLTLQVRTLSGDIHVRRVSARAAA